MAGKAGGYGCLTYEGTTYILRKPPVFKACDKEGVFTFYGFEPMYLCDPEKNTECKKTSCQKECKHTTNPKYKKEVK